MASLASHLNGADERSSFKDGKFSTIKLEHLVVREATLPQEEKITGADFLHNALTRLDVQS